MAIKYFSMFSGIGGFELGMEKSKHEFEAIGFSEVNKYAISIYTRQFPKHRNFGDATRIDPEKLEDFSILVGGFPCQAFSIAGSRKGFNDTRGTLFFEIARILASKQPTYFLLENVKGLLSHDGGRTFKTIIKVCDDLGYDVSWQVYNSKDYGVPQSRERLYIKGYFRGRCGSEILSLPRTSTETDDDVKLNQVNNYKKTSQSGRVYDSNGLSITLNADASNGYYYAPDDVKLKQLNNDVPRSFGDRVYSSDGLARTLCGDGGGLNDKTGLYDTLTCDGNLGTVDQDFLIRRLTPRECERLQGFPDDWTKFGSNGELISDTQRYKCLGNAVTVNVIQHIFDNWDLGE